jgi:Glycoside hydrolase 123, catalytic domain
VVSGSTKAGHLAFRVRTRSYRSTRTNFYGVEWLGSGVSQHQTPKSKRQPATLTHLQTLLEFEDSGGAELLLKWFDEAMDGPLTCIKAGLPRPLNARTMKTRSLLCRTTAGVLATASVILPGGLVQGQNLLPNPRFEEGATAPSGWRLVDGPGKWGGSAGADGRFLEVEGKGEDQSLWRTEDLELKPGGLYRLKLRGRREDGSSGGTAVAGTSRINRDFRLDASWEEKSFVFAAPSDATNDYVRLGQWHVQGRVAFAGAELAPVMAAHLRLANGGEIGEAESIRGGVYRFSPRFDWVGANAHRPLFLNRAGFNSDRWLFPAGAELVYRLGVAGLTQKSARVRVAINYYSGGVLQIEASRDGARWLAVTNYDGRQPGGVAALPAVLFPTTNVFVRLSHPGPGAGFQVNTFEYEAPLKESVPDAEGATHFLDVLHRSPDLAVDWQGLYPSDNESRWQLDFALTNRMGSPLNVRGMAWLDSESAPASIERKSLNLETDARLRLACPFGAVGSHILKVALEDAGGRVLFAGQTDVRLGFLEDPRPGYWLAETGRLGVWWCESGWKIGRERGLPQKPSEGQAKPVSVSAARGEYEPAQVILRPAMDGELRSATMGPWRNERGNTAAGISAGLDEVAYVQVTQPTDGSCLRGWYPDPLPPLRTPLPLRGGRNQPLWVTVHVSRRTPPGDYRGELTLKTTLGDMAVPMEVHVYGFTLPEQTHLKSALGLGTHFINRYHHLTRPEDQEAVFGKYLKNFAEHRISPYSFYDYAPMDIRFVGEGAAKRARIDFTKFDRAAAKWLDGFHLNTFKLPLPGMGGGTFHSRRLGRLEGFEEGTPEHARLFQDYLSQIERHLRERGWLDKAFTYWFDEPDPKDYAFVVAGMDRIKAAAPGVRRMLTEQPEKELIGHVDIWCGLTPQWTPEKVRARTDAGEEVWWYICTGPKAPYVTEFIDHPGTELRLWPWQSWQYGVSGILIWATTYWTSAAAFPPPRLQNPWEDPMSYVSGYDFGPGHVAPWGNGDGRFLYPPRRNPEADRQPNREDPVNSLRWENLRDGMEDYEYFWLLREAVASAREKRGQEDWVKQADGLLTVPAEISRDLKHFTTDPRAMLEHRDRIARMIERLQAPSSGEPEP